MKGMEVVKRTLAMFLAAVLMLSLAACGTSSTQQAESSGQAASGEELERAAEYGIASQETLDHPEETVTYSQFCWMLSAVIEKLYGAESLAQWEDVASLALAADTPMKRADGALAIFEAAIVVGMQDYHSNSHQQPDIDGLTMGEAIFGMRERTDYDLFPNWGEECHNINWDGDPDTILGVAAQYPYHRKSTVGGRAVMEYDETMSMRYEDPFTCEEAIKAALRLYESWTPRNYVRPEDAEALTYDSSIITDDLFSLSSSLPEVSAQELPADWRGLTIYSKGVTHYNIVEPFQERDLRFLSDNGFNFARVLIGFTTLGYPDHPENGSLVNLAELEDLDRLIAWGMRYDVHLSLCMLSPPGYASQEDVAHLAIKDWDYPSPEQWELIMSYWTMLAKRYAGIPSRNLSFELCTEWHLEEEGRSSDFKTDWELVIEAIRGISPERVLLASFDTAIPIKLKLAEDMASMGVALAAHPYTPWQIANGNVGMRQAIGFTGELSWPLVWFPSGDFNRRISPVTVSGELSETTLSVYVWGDGMAWEDESGEPVIEVYADGAPIASHTYTEGGDQDALTVQLPAGTKNVQIVHKSGYVELSCIRVDGAFGSAQTMPHDTSWGSDAEGEANLLLHAGGTWENADGRQYGSDEYYREALLPYVEIADQYHVGFMVNEFAFVDDEWDSTTPVPLDAILQYYSDAVEVFRENGIGSSLCFLDRIIMEKDFPVMWGLYPDCQEEQTLCLDNGREEHFFVNRLLLDTIRSAYGDP